MHWSARVGLKREREQSCCFWGLLCFFFFEKGPFLFKPNYFVKGKVEYYTSWVSINLYPISYGVLHSILIIAHQSKTNSIVIPYMMLVIRIKYVNTPLIFLNLVINLRSVCEYTIFLPGTMRKFFHATIIYLVLYNIRASLRLASIFMMVME